MADFVTLDSQVPDEVRFANCEPLVFICPSCREKSTFRGPAHRPKRQALRDTTNSLNEEDERNAISTKGIRCTNVGCQRMMPLPTLVVQLELAMRTYISRYYAGWTECNDSSCGSQTRMASVYPKRCVAVHDSKSAALLDDDTSMRASANTVLVQCKGRVEQVYRDKQLYDQLLYLESLCDVERIRERFAPSHDTSTAAAAKTRNDEVLAIVDVNATELDTLRKTVDKYLDKNGRRFVKLSSLFRFMAV